MSLVASPLPQRPLSWFTRSSFRTLWFPLWRVVALPAAGDVRVARFCVVSLLQLLTFGLFSRSEEAGSIVFLISLPLVAGFTRGIATAAVRPLAFSKMLPLPATVPKWLVLTSGSVLALAVVASHLVIWRHSLPDGLALLGLSWWAVAVGHWFAGRRGWLSVLAMTLCCWGAVLPGGILEDELPDLALSLLTLGLGVVGLALSPPDRISVVMSAGTMRPSWWRRADKRTRPARTFPTFGRPSRSGVLSFAWRIWLMATPRLPRYAMMVMAVALGAAGMFSPGMSFTWLSCTTMMGSMIGATSPAQRAFLRSLPVARWRLLFAVLAPGTLWAAVSPAFMFLGLTKQVFLGPEARAFFPPTRGTDKLYMYLHDVVGATFLPGVLPQRGLALDAWAQLRPLLYAHFARTGLLAYALLFALAAVFITSGPGREQWPRWPSRLLLASVVFATVPCLHETWLDWRAPWPAPPLSVAAGLALASALAFCVPLLYVPSRLRRVPSGARPRWRR